MKNLAIRERARLTPQDARLPVTSNFHHMLGIRCSSFLGFGPGFETVKPQISESR